MTDEQSSEIRAWDLMKKIGFCMLVTKDDQEMRSRPMAAHIEPGNNAIYFLTDASSEKDGEIENAADVLLAFADASAQKYVSVVGSAVVSNDREKISELWSTPAKAWWDSENDPAIRILRVNAKSAELWDSPGTAVSYIKMAAAAVLGTKPDVGDNLKTEFNSN